MFVTYEEVDVTWTAVNNWSFAAKLLSLSTSLILAEKYPNVKGSCQLLFSGFP